MVRRLETDEKALWQRVIASVQPIHPVKAKAERASWEQNRSPAKAGAQTKQAPSHPGLPPSRENKVSTKSPGLDGHWDRRINKGGIVPDVSIDLHDSNLSGAYARLDGALEQAIAQRMKVLLLVTGKARAHDRASGNGRGAIAAVVRDWLAASRHSSHISAVRTAHPRHGGTGALYIMLKR